MMIDKDQQNLPQDKDPHLDTPAEANRDKHINFLDAEDTGDDNTGSHKKDKITKERQEQWQQGLEEGRRTNNHNA